MKCKIDWDVVQSITSIIGVIATFSAVWVALNVNSIRLKMSTMLGFNTDSKKQYYFFSITNISNIRIRISMFGISMRRRKKAIQGDNMNKWIEPHEEYSYVYDLIKLKETLLDAINKKYIRKSDRIRMCAYDSKGKIHYHLSKVKVIDILEAPQYYVNN